MINDTLSLKSTIPPEAWMLIENLTLNEREVDQLVKLNCEELDAFLVLEIKNQIINECLNKHEEIAEKAIHITFINNLIFWCTMKAYRKGYETALQQYSTIVKNEILKASKAVNGHE